MKSSAANKNALDMFLETPAGRRYATNTKSAVGAVVDDSLGVELARALQPIVDSAALPYKLGAIDVTPYFNIPRDTEEVTAAFTAEGGPIPTSRYASAFAKMLAHQIASIVVFTRELEQLNEQQQIRYVERRIRRVLRRGIDTAFLSTNAASATSPGGILAGVSGISEGSPSGISGALENVNAAVADGDGERLVFITSGRAVMHLASLEGGSQFPNVRIDGSGHIAGVPLLVSPAAGNKLILVDASRIAVWTGTLELDESRHSAIEMDTAPTNNSATATATSLVSLWQANSYALKVVRHTSWIVTDVDHASYVELPLLGASPA
jgi:HK97 family phage major capsid protein